MKILSVFKYVKNYKRYAFAHIFFILFSIVFSAFSLTLVIPFLQVLFGTQALVTERPPLEFSSAAVQANLYYMVSFIILQYSKITALIFICVLVITAFFLKNLCRYMAQYFLSPIRGGIVRDLRADLYKKVMNLPLLYFSEKRKGDLISRMTVDVQEIEWAVVSSLEIIVREPATIITFLAFMIFMSPSLTLFVFLILPITGLIIGRLGKSLKKTSVKGQQRMGYLLSLIEESLGGLRIIIAFNAQKMVNDRFARANDNYKATFVSMTRKRDLSAPLSEFLGVLIVVVVIWFGGQLVLNNKLGAEFFIGYIVMFSQIIAPAKAFSTAYYNIQKGKASLERINAILKVDDKIEEKPDAKPINSFNTAIEFKNLSFAYGNEPVLKNINLTIPKGKTIALVGQSGAGKSTLVDLLPRFYDFSEGDILLDGQSIKNYKLADLRDLMGIVTQESILFNDTVFNNITFGTRQYSKEQVITAAKIANAHDFIMALPNGYDTSIGDRGNKLSGGMKQRITIARAMLKNPPILLLDEATSALDTESEKLVQDALYKLMQNRTSLVIAHRLTTIQHADEIIVMHKGEIVERGNHNQLLAFNGIYRKLYDMQGFNFA